MTKEAATGNRSSHRTRALAAAAALTVAASLAATPAAASPAAGTAIGAAADRTGQLAASRSVNVVGLPMRTSLPRTWPTASPMALYKSKTKKYPASIVYLAKVEKVSPATFVSRNRGVNLIAYGKSTNRFIPSITIMDVGNRRVTVAQLKKILKDDGATVTTTSAVKSRFGTVYRVHYRGRATNGVRYNGLTGLVRVDSKLVLWDSSAHTAKQAAAMSNLTIKSAARR